MKPGFEIKKKKLPKIKKVQRIATIRNSWIYIKNISIKPSVLFGKS